MAKIDYVDYIEKPKQDKTLQTRLYIIHIFGFINGCSFSASVYHFVYKNYILSLIFFILFYLLLPPITKKNDRK